MDIGTVGQLIGSLGFPIVTAMVLAVYIWKTGEQQRDLLEKMQANHKEEIEKLRDTIDNNTQVMIKIYERVGHERVGHD